MGMKFEKLTYFIFSTNRPKPVKQGQVVGNKNVLKVGLMCIHVQMLLGDLDIWCM